MPAVSLQIIREEHASIAAVLRSLQVLVEQGPGDNPPSFYLAFYREHMRLEETMVLPAAQAYLDDDDWAAVDAAFATNVNPLAHGRPRDPAYDRLFTRIVMRVKSPLGQG